MTTPNYSRDAAEARLGREIANVLSVGIENLPHDVTERLRVSRLHAMDVVRQQHRLTANIVHHPSGPASLALKADHLSWWGKMAAVLPALVLALGLFGISEAHDQTRAKELAAVDVALLTDALPPSAYTDPGFIRFVKLHEGDLDPVDVAQ